MMSMNNSEEMYNMQQRNPLMYQNNKMNNMNNMIGFMNNNTSNNMDQWNNGQNVNMQTPPQAQTFPSVPNMYQQQALTNLAPNLGGSNFPTIQSTVPIAPQMEHFEAAGTAASSANTASNTAAQNTNIEFPELSDMWKIPKISTPVYTEQQNVYYQNMNQDYSSVAAVAGTTLQQKKGFKFSGKAYFAVKLAAGIICIIAGLIVGRKWKAKFLKPEPGDPPAPASGVQPAVPQTTKTAAAGDKGKSEESIAEMGKNIQDALIDGATKSAKKLMSENSSTLGSVLMGATVLAALTPATILYPAAAAFTYFALNGKGEDGETKQEEKSTSGQ